MGEIFQRVLTTLLLAAPFAALPLAAQPGPAEEEARADTVEVTHVVFPEAVGRELDMPGGWLPVYLELVCRGDRPELVTVDGSVEYGEDRPPFATRTRFEVAPGAPRRAWIYLKAQPGVQGQTARISVTARAKPIRTGDRWTLNSYSHDFDIFPTLFVVGGEETDQRPWYGALATGGRGGKIRSDALQWFEPHQLPDRSIGYSTADVVILRGLDEADLEPGQIDALRQYVFLGGFVVLVPATRDATLFQGNLVQELLGDALGDLEVEQDFRPRNLFSSEEGETFVRGQDLRQRGRWRRPLAVEPVVKEEDLELSEDLTYTRIDVFADDAELLRALWSHPDEEVASRESLLADASLIYGEVAFGAGRVGVFTINDQAFSVRESGTFRRELWLRAIEPAVAGGTSLWRRETASFVKPSLVNNALKDTERDIGTFLIGTMVIGYLVLVGPGIYFYLRRRNRLPAIIWVEPLVILISVGLIFFFGYFTKGLLTKVRLTTLISKEEGSPLAVRETYMAIFSADDAEYRIESPRGELLIPLFANDQEVQPLRFDRRPAADAGEGGSGARLTLSGFHLSLWQQGYALNTGIEDVGTGVTLREIAPDGSAPSDTPRLAITNHLPYAIIAGEVSHRVGRRRLVEPIGSGETSIVDFSVPVPREPVEDEEAEEEDPGDAFDRLRPYSLGASRSGSRDLVFWGLLDRRDEDIRLDRAYSLAERKDYFVLYR